MTMCNNFNNDARSDSDRKWDYWKANSMIAWLMAGKIQDSAKVNIFNNKYRWELGKLSVGKYIKNSSSTVKKQIYPKFYPKQCKFGGEKESFFWKFSKIWESFPNLVRFSKFSLQGKFFSSIFTYELQVWYVSVVCYRILNYVLFNIGDQISEKIFFIIQSSKIKWN